MRVWRNAVLNLVVTSFDVGVAPATEADKSFSFKTLHSECNTPIKQQSFCPTCNKVAEETVKGIEYPKGQYIAVTADEIASTHPKTKQLIDIKKLIQADMLNEMLYDDPYWLIPSERGMAAQIYAAINSAMMLASKVGIGTVAFTDKEHPVALMPMEQGLCLWMLKQPKQFKVPDWELPEVDDKALRFAEMMVSEMTEQVADSDFVVPTRALQEKLVTLKTAGRKIEPVKQKEAQAVPDLMAAMADSVKLLQARKKAKKATKARAGARA